MKRRYNSTPLQSNKRLRNEDYISATKVNNYMLNDKLVDWLELYGKNYNFKKEKSTFKQFIFKKGYEYEEFIIKELKKKYKYEFIDIGTDKYNANNISFQEKTLEAMSKYRIIYSGCLINDKNKTFGIPDLLIRCDLIEEILDVYYPYSVIHYVVVDIKSSKLKICENEKISNINFIKANKGQLYIYNEALSELQHYNPQRAYILGKNTNGCIDFQTYDKDIIDITKEGIEWYKLLLNEGNGWNPYSHPLLKPNMCCKINYEWENIKNKIAKKRNDFTRYWYISEKFREETCNEIRVPDSFPKSRREYLQKIIDVNKGIEVPYKHFNLPLGYFIDFESVSSPLIENEEIVMIGVGYFIDENNEMSVKISENMKWKYHCLYGDNLIEKFLGLVDLSKNFYHWGYAEMNLWKKNNDIPVNFVDLNKIFIKNGCVLRKCYNTSLKSVAKGLNIEYTSDCKCGLDAMYELYQYFYTKERDDINDIILYNHYDVKILSEIFKKFN